jgi:hypothetical protein
MSRGICINPGCGKPQAHDGRRWRVHCGHCQGASYGKHPHAPGVTPWKQGQCSNHDAHLGFPCCINYKKSPWAVGMTEVDHRDGNRENNDPTNLDELCPMCHKHKGRISGDYNNQKHKTNNKRTTKGAPSQIKKAEAFHRLFGFLESDNDEESYNESVKRVA